MKKSVFISILLCMIIIVNVFYFFVIIRNDTDAFDLQDTKAIINDYYGDIDKNYIVYNSCIVDLKTSNSNNIVVKGYKLIYNIHKNIDGTFWCVAQNSIKDYILHIDEKYSILKVIETDEIPLRFFEYKNMMLGLFLENSCGVLKVIYSENIDNEPFIENILVEQPSIGNYLFENIHIKEHMIAYKMATEVDTWYVKDNDDKRWKFNSKDRCFGFVDDTSLLFYKNIFENIGIGYLYLYDYTKQSNKPIGIINQFSIQHPSVDATGKYLYCLGANVSSSDLSGFRPCFVDLQKRRKQTINCDLGNPSTVQFFNE